MDKKSARVPNQLLNIKYLPDSKRSARVFNQLFEIKFLPNSKRSMELSIPLLVLVTIVLVISALVVFNFNSRGVASKIGDYTLLDDMNIKEKQINFYINDIVENSISGILKGSDVKVQFIDNFNTELNTYKNGDEFYVKELGQLKSQVNSNNIKINGTKVSIVFRIEIGKEFSEKMTGVYSYEKEFYGFLS
ncbi:MAG: hypothetical protein PHF67_03200 [Candidatus Nanoarchaeia archaeon]|nr:hypothetical protein [Candidatus Nanoarchaeia archaeon]